MSSILFTMVEGKIGAGGHDLFGRFMRSLPGTIHSQMPVEEIHLCMLIHGKHTVWLRTYTSSRNQRETPRIIQSSFFRGKLVPWAGQHLPTSSRPVWVTKHLSALSCPHGADCNEVVYMKKNEACWQCWWALMCGSGNLFFWGGRAVQHINERGFAKISQCWNYWEEVQRSNVYPLIMGVCHNLKEIKDRV